MVSPSLGSRGLAVWLGNFGELALDGPLGCVVVVRIQLVVVSDSLGAWWYIYYF